MEQTIAFARSNDFRKKYILFQLKRAFFHEKRITEYIVREKCSTFPRFVSPRNKVYFRKINFRSHKRALVFSAYIDRCVIIVPVEGTYLLSYAFLSQRTRPSVAHLLEDRT